MQFVIASILSIFAFSAFSQGFTAFGGASRP